MLVMWWQQSTQGCLFGIRFHRSRGDYLPLPIFTRAYCPVGPWINAIDWLIASSYFQSIPRGTANDWVSFQVTLKCVNPWYLYFNSLSILAAVIPSSGGIFELQFLSVWSFPQHPASTGLYKGLSKADLRVSTLAPCSVGGSTIRDYIYKYYALGIFTGCL